MDNFRKINQNSKLKNKENQKTNSIDSFSIPSSPTSSTNSSIQLTSDPLQRWVVFSPNNQLNQQIQQDNETLSDDQNQSIILPSMPNHDGRGHFYDSNSIHSSQSSHHFSLHSNHSTPISFVSPSEIHSDDDELLSMPSSISANLSRSRRSSDSALNPYSNYSIPYNPELTTFSDTPVLLNSSHIPTDPIESNQIKLTESSLSFHRSIQPDQVIHSNQKRATSRRRNPSHTSLPSPIEPIPSSYLPTPIHHQNPPSISFLPAQENIQKNINYPPQMPTFLSNVALKLLDIHPDTLNLLSSDLQLLDQNSNLLSQKTTMKKQNFLGKRFMIGDGDTERIRLEKNQSDEIQPPLDLSGFTSPIRSQEDCDHEESCTLSSLSEEDEHEEDVRTSSITIYRSDSYETFRPKHSKRRPEKKELLNRSLSDHQVVSSDDHSNLDVHHLSRSFSSPDNPDQHTNILLTSNSSSIAGILFRKVWNEWINWDI